MTRKEMVLYYSPARTGHNAKFKGTLVRMGIQIRNIESGQFHQKVGYLAGIPGYGEEPSGAEKGEIPEEMLVMKNFTQRRMEELLFQLKKAKIPPIPMKAMITETNADWTFYELYREISREHERMTAKKAKVIRIEEPDFGCEGRPEKDAVMDKVILQWVDSKEEFVTEAEEAELLRAQINEGDEVLVTCKGRILTERDEETFRH